MYIALFYADWFSALLLPSLWLVTAYLIDRLPVYRTLRRLRIGATAALAVAIGAIIVTVLRALVFAGHLFYGWDFAQEHVVLSLPAMAPTLVVCWATLPRLWRLARSRPHAGTPSLQPVAASPGVSVPVVAALLGSLVSTWASFYPPYRMNLSQVGILFGVVVVVTIVAWIRQMRRHAASAAGRPVAPGLARRVAGVGLVALVLFGGSTTWFVAAMQASELSDHINMGDHGHMDFGGASSANGHDHDEATSRSVTDLTGPRDGTPDSSFTLTAQQTPLSLSSGETIEAWTFNGQAPGPELRLRQGDLVEVTLVNRDIADGVTIHWHGVDVPNAEDGVAGLTQDAVLPGEQYSYRFIAEDAGTYWYHSHQVSSEQVRKGLFGAFVVEPANDSAAPGLDESLMFHNWPTPDDAFRGTAAIGASDTVTFRTVAPGTAVRLRLINTNNTPIIINLSGTPFRVVGIDGGDVNEPTDLRGSDLRLAGGGRYDIAFTMPDGPVLLGNHEVGVAYTPDGSGPLPDIETGSEFKPDRYGTPLPAEFDLSSAYDRTFTLELDQRFGFYDGAFKFLFTINGEVFLDTPMLMVDEGDLVKTTIINRSAMDHPMHLHGHHILVLERNGRPTSGSPWWADTLNVAPGETFVVAFVADNPGIWMDHCHNLDHAAVGMTMHLNYSGITTPFEVGAATRNQPE